MGYSFYVTGRAVLRGGTLKVSIPDDFMPAGGDRFQVFDAGRIEGKFEEIILPDMGADKIWSIDDLYEQGIVRIVKK